MRKIKILSLSGLVLMIFIASNQAAANSYSDTMNRFQKSPVVQPFFDDAYGYAVFPTIGKGGMGLGFAFGKGRVYKQGEVTGSVSVGKASIGFQIGGQVFSEMIFFQDKRAYDEFTKGNFELEASASAVAITAGLQAKSGSEGESASATAGPATTVQAEAHYQKGMAVFVYTKGGLMFEAAVGGQKFTFKPY